MVVGGTCHDVHFNADGSNWNTVLCAEVCVCVCMCVFESVCVFQCYIMCVSFQNMALTVCVFHSVLVSFHMRRPPGQSVADSLSSSASSRQPSWAEAPD